MFEGIEAVVLTGGMSRRMGEDKASLLVRGTSLAVRTASLLATQCSKVTILGRAPVEGFEFQLDDHEFGGPRKALDGFSPSTSLVFVASCDMPLFSPSIVGAFRQAIGDYDAALPMIDGFLQPLCALYKGNVLGRPAHGEASMMALVRRLSYLEVSSEELERMGLDPGNYRNCNTLEEFRAALTHFGLCDDDSSTSHP